MTIRVLLVDDHGLFRVGLTSELEDHEDLEVIAQASGGRMAVRLAKELGPDVVLMDLRMPDFDGLQATRAILEHDPSMRVVALTVLSEESEIEAALAAGACGYVLKEASSDDVVAAVRAAAHGTAWLSPGAAETLLRHIRQSGTEAKPAPSEPDVRLSARELEVLQLVASGLDNSEIAARLGISPVTAKNHVSRILAKLGVPSRLEAAVYAVRRGLA
jgi:DNA-binding NarL/FixJ family response regulator